MTISYLTYTSEKVFNPLVRHTTLLCRTPAAPAHLGAGLHTWTMRALCVYSGHIEGLEPVGTTGLEEPERWGGWREWNVCQRMAMAGHENDDKREPRVFKW